MDNYFKKVLAEILSDEQKPLKEFLDLRFEDGYEFEGETRYSFESLLIHEAVQVLKDEWEYLEPFYQ